MAAPKAPQDHKKKIEKAKETDITITVDGEELTVRGYQITVGDITVDVEKDAVQSWEFAEAVSEHDGVRMAKLVLGDQYVGIRDSFKDSRGRVAAKEFSEFVNEVIGAFPNS